MRRRLVRRDGHRRLLVRRDGHHLIKGFAAQQVERWHERRT
jgi:hypothetical protein